MDSDPRTREGRQRAEEALVRLALLAGSHVDDFVVIGGLNPDYLVREAPVPHQGTTDIDLLIELAFAYDRETQDFGWLEEILERASLREHAEGPGWRWDIELGPSIVRVDLLCDVADNPGQAVALPGARIASAQNLQGPAVALENPILREILVPESVREDFPDCPPAVGLRFAGLGAYIAAKSAALLSRGLPKDAYDLMYVILYNPAGPRGAASATRLAISSHRPSLHRDVGAAAARFIDVAGDSAEHFAQQMRAAGDDAPETQLRTDASVGARQFLDGLG